MAKAPKDLSGADYEVGYGKPPKDTRFKPGADPRRRGRKKGSENIATVLERAAFTMVKVPLNGRMRNISMMELVYRSLVTKAAKGDVQATRHFSELLSIHLKGATETSDEPLGAEDTKILEAFLRRNRGDDGQ